jgi:hypothetical protein
VASASVGALYCIRLVKAQNSGVIGSEPIGSRSEPIRGGGERESRRPILLVFNKLLEVPISQLIFVESQSVRSRIVLGFFDFQVSQP